MNPVTGTLLIIFSNALFSLSHSSVRWLSNSYSLYLLMFVRFVSGPLLLLPYMLYKKYSFQVRNWPLVFIRTVCGFLSMGCYFYSFKFIEIGKATLLFNFSIIWTLIMAMLIFKDKPSWQTKLAVPIALGGLYLVLKPDHFIMISFGECVALLGSFFNAGVVISLKALRQNHQALVIVLLNYSISSVILFFPSLITPIPIPTFFQIIALLVSSVVGLLGQVLMTKAYEYTPASIAGAASLVGVPLMGIIGVIFFKEHPDIFSIIGGSIVFLCLGIITRYQ